MIEVEQAMSCDASDFIVSAGMKVWGDGRPVLNQSWLERIPRDLV